MQLSESADITRSLKDSPRKPERSMRSSPLVKSAMLSALLSPPRKMKVSLPLPPLQPVSAQATGENVIAVTAP